MLKYTNPFRRRLTGTALALAGSLLLYGCAEENTSPGNAPQSRPTFPTLSTEQSLTYDQLNNAITGAKNGILGDAANSNSQVKPGEFGASNTAAMNANNGQLINQKFPQITLLYSTGSITLEEQDPYIDYASGSAYPNILAGIAITYTVAEPNALGVKQAAGQLLDVGDFTQVLGRSDAKFTSVAAQTGVPDVQQYIDANPLYGTFTLSQVAANPTTPAVIATTAAPPNSSAFADNVLSIQRQLSEEI
jgi:hypothetical protein